MNDPNILSELFSNNPTFASWLVGVKTVAVAGVLTQMFLKWYWSYRYSDKKPSRGTLVFETVIVGLVFLNFSMGMANTAKEFVDNFITKTPL